MQSKMSPWELQHEVLLLSHPLLAPALVPRWRHQQQQSRRLRLSQNGGRRQNSRLPALRTHHFHLGPQIASQTRNCQQIDGGVSLVDDISLRCALCEFTCQSEQQRGDSAVQRQFGVWNPLGRSRLLCRWRRRLRHEDVVQREATEVSRKGAEAAAITSLDASCAGNCSSGQ